MGLTGYLYAVVEKGVPGSRQVCAAHLQSYFDRGWSGHTISQGELEPWCVEKETEHGNDAPWLHCCDDSEDDED